MRRRPAPRSRQSRDCSDRATRAGCASRWQSLPVPLSTVCRAAMCGVSTTHNRFPESVRNGAPRSHIATTLHSVARQLHSQPSVGIIRPRISIPLSAPRSVRGHRTVVSGVGHRNDTPEARVPRSAARSDRAGQGSGRAASATRTVRSKRYTARASSGQCVMYGYGFDLVAGWTGAMCAEDSTRACLRTVLEARLDAGFFMLRAGCVVGEHDAGGGLTLCSTRR